MPSAPALSSGSCPARLRASRRRSRSHVRSSSTPSVSRRVRLVVGQATPDVGALEVVLLLDELGDAVAQLGVVHGRPPGSVCGPQPGPATVRSPPGAGPGAALTLPPCRPRPCRRVPSRRSAPTTSAACCGRRRCSGARRSRGRPNRRRGAAGGRGRGDPRVVAMQEDVGLQAATDGEFRRASWHMDFIYQLGGVGRAERRASGPVPQRAGRHRVHPGRAAGGRADPAGRADLRRRLHVPASRR